MDIANASGAAVRSDLNSALTALVGLSSGTSAPATMFAYQWWADTTNNVLKQRNAANSAWTIKGSLDTGVALAKTTTYTAALSDRGKVINATGTWTLSLTAAATLTSDWFCALRNNGTGVITVDPNSSETIDGLTTIAVQPGETVWIVCDGSNFVTLGRRSAVPTRTETADYTALPDDRGKLILMNKATAVALNLTAAATLGAGWWCYVKNINTGTLTIDPNSSETIDGSTTITKAQNQGAIIVCDGSNFFSLPLGGGGTTISVAILQDQKSSGTAGGTFTSGAWQTRTLNTEVFDPDGITSLSSNEFTLQAGKYRITAFPTVGPVNGHQSRIYNVTDASVVALGANSLSNGSGAYGNYPSPVEGYADIAGAKNFRIEHRANSTRSTDGFGQAGSWGTEVYTIVVIEKIG